MPQNDTAHSYYHDQSTAKYQLRFFGHFAENFSQPNFELGHFQAMPVVLNGPRKPVFILSDVANDFVTYCIVEKLVDLRIDADAELSIGKSLFGNNRNRCMEPTYSG